MASNACFLYYVSRRVQEKLPQQHGELYILTRWKVNYRTANEQESTMEANFTN